MESLTWQIATVAEKISETAKAYSIGLDVPQWTRAAAKAGQHVDVRLTAEDGYRAERSYSIASPPESSLVWLTVERLEDGEVSPYLTDELRVGDLLEMRGPIGGYFVWEASKQADAPLFLIAGGSGIVPLMAMIRHRAEAKTGTPTRLLYSARSIEDVIYRAELGALDERRDGFAAIYTLTREQPDDWAGYARRIDRRMLEEIGYKPSDKPNIFVCGPTAFVESAADLLQDLGHAPERIKTERFGPTGG